MFPCWPSTKIVQVIMIRRKTWPPWGGAYFPSISIQKSLKIFWSETNGRISVSLGRNVSLVTSTKIGTSHHDLSKNMATRGQGIFSLYIYVENFKNLLVRKLWILFGVTWQECCFGDLLPRLFMPLWYVKKHGVRARVLFSVKFFLSETTRQISILLGRNVALVTLYHDCSSNRNSSKNMAARGGAYFPYISK